MGETTSQCAPILRESPRRTSINVLGIQIDCLNMEGAVARLDTLIARNQPSYVCLANAHVAVECQFRPEFMAIQNAAASVFPDGAPVAWLARILGSEIIRRVPGPELMERFCKHSVERGYRHFFLGGAPGVVERMRDRLTEQYPGLRIVGTLSPPFRKQTSEERAATISFIRSVQPDVVWVGLGAPKQEIWMAEHVASVGAPVMIGVGFAFDVHSGVKKAAPDWMRRSGLEWAYRLASEPRRLWRRYLVTIPLFLGIGALQVCGFRYPGSKLVQE